MQDLSKPFNLSYWELNSVFKNVDLVIIGAGIVGMNAALQYKLKKKNAKILILERGILPYGASTKNAGFACFGSVSEIIADIEKYGETQVWKTVKMRIEGLQTLKKIVGIKNMSFEKSGGYELFFNDLELQKMESKIPLLNSIFQDLLNKKNVWALTLNDAKKFGFKGVSGMILNKEEGAIDTGKMMNLLYLKCIHNNIKILNCINVNSYLENDSGITLNLNEGLEIKTGKLIIASNGFSKKFLTNYDVSPARAQVLVTSPIPNLKVKGTFHFDEGYYYFRNIDNRILFGGARNMDFENENTTEFGISEIIQNKLKSYLTEVILPNTKFEIEHSWSGIMGVGNSKEPITKKVSNNVYCSVRMGGMGVAIGSLAGINVANIALES
jgi:glycine/D-amino acid oxidase-like deaminating enzyme